MTVIKMTALLKTKVDFLLKHLESKLSEVLPNKNNLSSVRKYHFQY